MPKTAVRIAAVPVYIVATVWGVVMAAASICFAAISVCLLTRLNICGLIPSMPYGCAVLLAICLAALAVFIAIDSVCYADFLRIIRLKTEGKRLVKAAKVVLAVFVGALVLSMIVCT